jgi:hypothetical protein
MTYSFILLTATNGGLKAGMIFGIIMAIIFGFASIVMFFEMKSQKTRKQILGKLPYVLIGLLFCGVGIYIYLLEYNILTNYQYVEGTTIGYCNPGESGRGIEFEYILNGQRYTNCNTYNAINKIKVPGGKFKVRVSEFAPSIGRIDFDKPITIENKINY